MSNSDVGITTKGCVTEFDNTTKTIHTVMAIVLTIQMVIGLLVHDPRTKLYLYAHEYVGIASTIVILVEWLWIYTVSQFSVLFPWNRAGMQQVVRDIKNLGKRILPEGGNTVGLSGFWHGIGITSFTLMALTGILLLLVLPRGNSILGLHSNDFVLYTEFAVVHRVISYTAWVKSRARATASSMAKPRARPAASAEAKVHPEPW